MAPTWRHFALSAVLLGGCWEVGATEIYRWVDADGVTHLSQTPPPSGGFQSLALPSVPATDAGAAVRMQREVTQVEEWQRERVLSQARERAALERQGERERRCLAAQHDLTTLTNLGARRIKRPDGSSVRPSPEELNRLTNQARAEQAQSCD